jgi:hypothetical protein
MCLRVLSACLVLFICTVSLCGQKQDRVIDKVSWRSEPVKIEAIENNKRKVQLRQKFSADDDWLDGFKVTVKNTSDKVITRVVIQLSFLKASDLSGIEPTYFVLMIYGSDPADKEFDPAKELAPGNTADVNLVRANVPIIKEDLKQLGYPDSRAQLKLEAVTFIDGTMWSGDIILYPDPNNPKEKINPRHGRPKSARTTFGPRQRALPGQTSFPEINRRSYCWQTTW